jgi:hypothetical protein
MSIYDSFADKPNRIKEEGQEITVRFSRIDDETGKVTWNIPPSYKGCKGNGVYDGIVITVSRKPADYIESSPKNGEYYIGDPTVDPDMHSGSKIINSEDNKVLVVGAFYNDRETTELDVMDLEPRTAYYFSAYAVDNVARYHREGVHSYSLPTGIEESGSEELTPAKHSVEIDQDIKLSTATGVKTSKTYTIRADINEENDVEIKINGNNAQTYKALIDEINKQYALLENPYLSPSYPDENTYFQEDGKFYLWDGENKTEIEYIESDTDPTTATAGDLWYDTENGVLNEYDGSAWVPQTLITYDFDITNPEEGTIWFDGTIARIWKNNIWCDLNTIIDTRNPLLPTKFSGTAFWYNTDTGEFFERDKDLKKWDERLVIYYSKDPNTIDVGDFWFDETNEEVYELLSGLYWQKLENIEIEETNSNPDGETDTIYRYVIDEQKLYEWTTLQGDPTGEWFPIPIAVYPTDPRDRESCNLWWDASLSVDSVFMWDSLNGTWVMVDNFYQQDTDPALPQKLETGSVWYNPDTEELLKILDSTCQEIDFINETFDPFDPPVGIYWKDGDTFKIWNGSSWQTISPQPLLWDTDPTLIPNGTYWLDSLGDLYIWDGTSWVAITIASEDPKPDEGFLWFNTIEEQLYEWKIDEWIKTTGRAYIEYEPKEKVNQRDKLTFKTKKLGCDAFYEMKSSDDNIFNDLTSNVRYTEAREGQDLVNGSPMYKRLGVGDDGSPDERRELHDQIRQILGEPSVKVELSKSNIDVCIDNGLKQLRKYGGASYKRGFFFLDFKPNQQRYVLEDRCAGFHKIVNVNAVYRLRSGFLQGAYSGYDIYGYAALKQLYTLGSFDLLSFHLVSSFIEELETLFATRITYQFVERTRELNIYNAIYKTERVLVDASVERTEQDLMSSRDTNLWLQRWAVAEAKIMLSQSRGKFQTLPGPNGNTTLNAQELITQSEAEKAVLMDELEDISMSGIEEVGQKGYFVLG